MAKNVITTQQAQTIIGLRERIRREFPNGFTDDMVRLLTEELIETEPPQVMPSAPKSEKLIQLLSRPKGATIDDVVKTFGIKKNSAYARVSVETRKRGLKVERVDGHYHVHA